MKRKPASLKVILLVVGMFCATPFPQLLAQSIGDERWDYRFAVPGIANTEGLSLVMAAASSNIYIGGGFQVVGRTIANSIVRYDGQNFTALPDGPRFDPRQISILTMQMFQDRLYVGGYFTNVAGTPSGGLGRWDGTNWSVPGGDAGGVFALQPEGGSLLVGGNFSLPGWTNPITLARWNGSDWSVLNYEAPDSPVGANASRVVLQLGLVGGQIYAVVGSYWGDNSSLVRSDGSNQWVAIPAAPPLSTGIGVFQGKLVMADFSASNVCSFDGTNWQSLGGGFPNEILSLAANDHLLLVAYRADDGNEPPKYAMSCYDGTNWSRLGTNLFAADYVRPVILPPNDAVYACGNFSIVADGLVPGLARWNGQKWEALVSGEYHGLTGYNCTAYAFAQHQGETYMGGIFLWAGALENEGVVRWNGHGWNSVAGGGAGPLPTRVRALASSGPLLYAGGVFTNMGGIPAVNVAAWDGVKWNALGTGTDGEVLFLSWAQNALFAAGSFTTAGGVAATNLAKWTGEAWQALSSGCGFTVRAMAAWKDKVFVGGYSFNETGNWVVRLACWDGAVWEQLDGAFDHTAGHGVRALAGGEDGLYVGGDFVASGTSLITNLARWDGTNWHSVGNVSPAIVSALSVRDGTLFAAGCRTNDTEIYSGIVYRIAGTNCFQLGGELSRPGINVVPRALLGTADKIFVGGTFTFAGSKPSVGVARWVENPQLLLELQRPAFGPSLHLRATSDPGLRFDLEAGADLVGWEKVGSGEGGQAEWTLDSSTNGPHRFFRAVAKP